ncbi:AP-3 complex subunit beta [Dispira parvispora]|uniref:AP-3 complex subunit beta n=1 Tax=Dispira parvispora TaxID=1520584 RepID=A0A9W8AR14_9FUNG|nr:AP-3 complex subunit beta [Dispira parvispora]
MADYFTRAAALAHSAAEISKRVSEGLVENAKDFGFESPVQFFDTAELKLSDVKEKLDSRLDRDKLDGMKRLIAVICKGHDASSFFPDVVKNVASSNLEIRQLVYMYLLRYAEQEQDLALLSINTFQKDLSDPNQGIRAMALRVLSGIRVPIISSIVLMAIQKGVADKSPYVRKIAAYAIPKLYSLDPSLAPSLVSVIKILLQDNTPMAIGSVIQAFNEVCPDQFDLIHPHFAKLCHMLIDTDEWGQVAIVNLLMRYARTQFLNPNTITPSVTTETLANPETDNRSGTLSASGYSSVPEGNAITTSTTIDPDHLLLQKSFTPLLQSDNSAVVMAVVAALYHIAPHTELRRVVKPLIRLLRHGPELEYVVLTHIAIIGAKRPDLFEDSIQHFYIRPTDPPYIWELKMQILNTVVSSSNYRSLLREIQQYIRSDQPRLAQLATQTLALCVLKLPQQCTSIGLRGLVTLSRHPENPDLVAQATVMLRVLVQRGAVATAHLEKLLINLLSLLTGNTAPLTRANIYWLIGEYGDKIPDYTQDALRMAARTFGTETTEVKLAVVAMAAKLAVLSGRLPMMAILIQYVFTLARYDLNYDVRDRARFLQQVSLPFLQQPRDSPALLTDLPDQGTDTLQSPSEETVAWTRSLLFNQSQTSPTMPSYDLLQLTQLPASEFTLGSLSLVLDRPIEGYESLANWPEVQPPAVHRGTEAFIHESRRFSHFKSSDFESWDDGNNAPTEESSANTPRTFSPSRRSRHRHHKPPASRSQRTQEKVHDDNDDLEAFYNQSDGEDYVASVQLAARQLHSSKNTTIWEEQSKSRTFKDSSALREKGEYHGQVSESEWSSSCTEDSVEYTTSEGSREEGYSDESSDPYDSESDTSEESPRPSSRRLLS